MIPIPQKDDFWFLPLGGVGEFGMNLSLFGHNNEWLAIDLGIAFYDKLGIEVLTPNINSLIESKKNLIGLLLTHAHEDHIGAIPYLWPLLRCPIYGTAFTIEVVRQKIKEKTWFKEVPLIEVPLSGTINVGSFTAEFISLTHSIPEPNAIALSTSLGTIVHSGDWSIDYDPVVGEKINYQRLIEIGDQGVLALFCDSCNIFKEKKESSEKSVQEEILRLINNYSHHRITVACFASNVARLKSIALAASKHNRRVVLLGLSLKRMSNIAHKCGYLDKNELFIDENQAKNLPLEKLLFIMTGSQGEPLAALSKIASRQHPLFRFNEKDVVLFSSSVIPGNEREIAELQNQIILSGAHVITSLEEDIHVSGHPTRSELKEFYKWIRPDVLIPVHGEVRHLAKHASFALEQGIKRVSTPYNGDILKLNDGGTPCKVGKVAHGIWAIDGNQLRFMDSPVLKERARLASQGAVFISIFQRNKKISITPVGIVEEAEQDEVLQILSREISHIIMDTKFDSVEFEIQIKKTVRKIISENFAKRPQTYIHFLS
ncbi:MAG: ribonuclease J [Alphaproteobacteria bacterium]